MAGMVNTYAPTDGTKWYLFKYEDGWVVQQYGAVQADGLRDHLRDNLDVSCPLRTYTEALRWYLSAARTPSPYDHLAEWRAARNAILKP